MPIDVSTKIGGMETIASALSDGKHALAKIAAVQLRFPDPRARPRSEDCVSDRMALAAELYWSALLKADDDWNEKRPRTGTKPNPGRFAEKPKDPNLPEKLGWPLPAANKKVKTWIAERAGELIMDAGRLIIRGIPVVDAISSTPTVRQSLSQSDFATQRAAGLEALRKRGVLK